VALGRELASRLDDPTDRTPAAPTDAAGQIVLDALGHGPMALDELADRMAQPVASLTSALLLLELDGKVEALPGNRYQRLPG